MAIQPCNDKDLQEAEKFQPLQKYFTRHETSSSSTLQNTDDVAQTIAENSRATPSSPSGNQDDTIPDQSTVQLWNDRANKLWLFEIVACCISVGCFFALVAVLKVSDQTAVTRWVSNHLTLNGLVALLTTFIRVSMMVSVASGLGQLKWNTFHRGTDGGDMFRKLKDLDGFDQASRGPWGSLKLLLTSFRLDLSTIGAIISIATLALDTFSQQVFVLVPKDMSYVNGTNADSLSRSDLYAGYSTLSLAGGDLQTVISDLPTKAAIYSALFDYKNIAAPDAQCSTGNCTWPTTPSVAVCGSCTEMTQAVDATCTSSPDSDIYENCTYTLHDGGDYTFALEYKDTTRLPAANSPALLVKPFRSSHYSDQKTPYISTFVEIDVPYQNNSSPNVRTCGLWFCAQAYKTTIRNGIITQHILGNVSEVDFDGSAPPVGAPFRLNFTNIPESFNLPAGRNLSVAPYSLWPFEREPMFNTSVYYSDTEGIMNWGDLGSRDIDISMALYHVSDWHYWIDRLALSMTNNVRRTGISSISDDYYAGEIFSSVAFVHVRWLWLVFPASLVVLSVLFLSATMWQAQRRHVKPWKSSVLAVLMCSVDETVESTFRAGRTVKNERVRLQYVGNEGLFVKADKSE